MLKDSLYYAAARGIPGVVNFLAVLLFTRLLSTEEYGFYALVVAAVTLGNTVVFQWLKVSLARFYHRSDLDSTSLVTVVFLSFWITATMVSVLAALYGVTSWMVADRWPAWLPIGIAILWGQSWFELNVELARAQLKPSTYGVMTAGRAVGILTLGLLLVLAGFQSYGLLWAMLIILWGLGAWGWRTFWYGNVDRGQFDLGLLRRMLVFGLPLTATFAMGVIVSTLDRFMLGWLNGAGAAGEYAVGYDLAWNIISLFLLVINLAAYPHLMRSYEKDGEAAARAQFKLNGVLLVAAALPAVIAFSCLVSALAPWLVGEAFQASVVAVVPVICIAALLKGLKSFYFDQAFHLCGRTNQLVWIMTAAAVSNLGFNAWFIPVWGPVGAAWATVLSFVLGLGMSVIFSLRVFPVPLWSSDLGWVLLLNLGVGLVLWSAREAQPGLALAIGIGVALVYLLGLFAFNVAGVRAAWKRRELERL